MRFAELLFHSAERLDLHAASMPDGASERADGTALYPGRHFIQREQRWQTGAVSQPEDCQEPLPLKGHSVTFAGSWRPSCSGLPRKYSLKCPEMLGLRARREIGSSRLPDSAKGQTTPVPARDRLCGPECDDFVIVSKISPHPEVLTQTNLVIQSRPDSDSMDLRPIGASDGLTSFCGSSRRESC